MSATLHADLQEISDALPTLQPEDVPRMQLRLLKLAVLAKRLEVTCDELVADAMEEAALPVPVPPVAGVVVAFPKARRIPVQSVGEEIWR